VRSSHTQRPYPEERALACVSKDGRGRLIVRDGAAEHHPEAPFGRLTMRIDEQSDRRVGQKARLRRAHLHMH
jgi:hypothetical protein